ncbi:tape measure domain-containing protein [Rhodococcus erythropolis]|uniref:tape measure protein n=1 Tax=Rhodococcus erythropolis TaxID=1833 RepID=UPI000876986B|nr:tape measure protein [Rhodococcus erythropolis]SCZ14304.1 tape measure domain-containing protein [Rhodococcus erythropolis]
MPGVELGVGYLSIVPETSKIVPGITKEINSAGVVSGADKAGRGIGSKIASGIGTTLKVGAAATGAAAAGVIGTALTLGMQRVVAIDDAKGKLAGLGHEAQSVDTIMDNALTSVKGTAYGLGDAATIAASAVAAGIAPGQELTKYLGLTADAATIAGSSLEEMGSIFNKVQTSGKAYTDNLNQLADRGIPIFQWLQKEYGVSADELSDMVKQGKVDSETFRKVIEENIGGAALESGKTLRGAWANTKAALGRAGAAAIQPFLPMMKAGLAQVTGFVDKITPKVEAGAKAAAAGLTELGQAFVSSGSSIDGPATKMEKFGVKAREVYDGLSGVWSILSKGEFRGSSLTFGLEEDSPAVATLFKVREGLQAIKGLFSGDDAGDIGAMFEKLSKTGGDAEVAIDGLTGAADENKSVLGQLWDVTKQVGDAVKSAGVSIVELGGDSVTVAASGLRVVGNTMGFLADHSTIAQGAVIGLGASLVGFKGAVAIGNIGRFMQAIQAPANWIVQRQLTAALNENSAAMRANIAAMGGVPPAAAQSTAARIRDAAATRAQSAAARIGAATTVTSSQALVRFATAQRVAATSNGVFVGGMRQATASAAMFGARVQSAGTAALGGMRTAAGGLAGFLTGPWGIAIAAAAAGFLLFSGSGQDAEQRAQEIQGAVSDLATTLHESGGAYTAAGQNAAAAALESIKLADSSDTLSQTLENVGVSAKTAAAGLAGNVAALKQTREELAAQAGSELDVWGSTFKMPDFSWKSILSGFTPGGAKEQAEDAYFSDNPAAKALKAYDEAEAAIREKQDSLRRIDMAAGNLDASGTATALGTMRDTMKEFAESTGGASAKVDILSSGLAKLRGDQMSAEDAQQKVNDSIRSFGEAAQNAGGSVIDAQGKINTTTSAGSRLYDAMKGVQSAFDQAGASARQSASEQGLSTQQAADMIQAAGQQVRDDFIATAIQMGLTEQQARALADTYGLIPEKLPTQVLLTGTAEATAAIDAFIAANSDRKILVDIVQNVVAPGPSNAPASSLGDLMLPGKAEGGSITGGTKGVDSVPFLGMDGEHVLDTTDVAQMGGQAAVYRFRQLLKAGRIAKFALGGAISTAKSAIRGVEGNEYAWGGTGPTNFDCSGFVGWVQQILMGLGTATGRIYTTYTLIDGALAGLAKGLNPKSPFNVGVSQEHMAATLDGQPVESGGAHGTSGIGGGRAKAEDSQFPYKFHLPLEKFAGYEPGETYAGAGTAAGTSDMDIAGSKWTKDDELALESARVAITQAKEARDKVYANEKKTDADRQQADLKVARAEQKVSDLEAKRANETGIESYGPAPDLPGSMTDEQISLRSAELALTDAELDRDRVYGDPKSTSKDKEKADMSVYQARNRLADEQTAATGPGDGLRVKTFEEIGSDLGGILAGGILETLGLQDSFLADPNKFFVDNTGTTGGRTSGPVKKPKPKDVPPTITPPPTITISPEEVFSQLPVPLSNGMTMADVLQKFPPFDTGGVAVGRGLMPKDIIRPERTLGPKMTEDFERLVGVLEQGDVFRAFESENPIGGGGSTTYSPSFTGLLDEEQMFSMFERWQRRTQTGGGQRTVAHRSRRR